LYRGAKQVVFVYESGEKAGKNTAQQMPLVMVHGFRGTHHGLLEIVEEILKLDAERGVRRQIFVPDLANFGESEPFRDEVHSAESYAGEVAALIDEIRKKTGAAKVDLFGHSFGTLIAARVAQHEQELVRRLVLASPIAMPALSHMNAKASHLYFKVGELLPGRAANAWLRAKFAIKVMNSTSVRNRTLRPEILVKHLAHFSDFHNYRKMLESYESASHDDILSIAGEITQKTLVISGDEDTIAPTKEARELAERIPHAEFKEIPKVGHIIHHETPAAVAELMTSFLL
jgi:pimeloyl-ACP methyl ester carboxylesterase